MTPSRLLLALAVLIVGCGTVPAEKPSAPSWSTSEPEDSRTFYAWIESDSAVGSATTERARLNVGCDLEGFHIRFEVPAAYAPAGQIEYLGFGARRDSMRPTESYSLAMGSKVYFSPAPIDADTVFQLFARGGAFYVGFNPHNRDPRVARFTTGDVAPMLARAKARCGIH